MRTRSTLRPGPASADALDFDEWLHATLANPVRAGREALALAAAMLVVLVSLVLIAAPALGQLAASGVSKLLAFLFVGGTVAFGLLVAPVFHTLYRRRLALAAARAALADSSILLAPARRRRATRPLDNSPRRALVNGRFRFTCDRCHQGNWAEPESRGHHARCRTCLTVLRIPAAY